MGQKSSLRSSLSPIRAGPEGLSKVGSRAQAAVERVVARGQVGPGQRRAGGHLTFGSQVILKTTITNNLFNCYMVNVFCMYM